MYDYSIKFLIKKKCLLIYLDEGEKLFSSFEVYLYDLNGLLVG